MKSLFAFDSNENFFHCRVLNHLCVKMNELNWWKKSKKKKWRKVMKWLLIYEESNDSLFISTLHECLPFTSRFIGWTLAIVELCSLFSSMNWNYLCEYVCLCVRVSLSVRRCTLIAIPCHENEIWYRER